MTHIWRGGRRGVREGARPQLAALVGTPWVRHAKRRRGRGRATTVLLEGSAPGPPKGREGACQTNARAGRVGDCQADQSQSREEQGGRLLVQRPLVAPGSPAVERLDERPAGKQCRVLYLFAGPQRHGGVRSWLMEMAPAAGLSLEMRGVDLLQPS